jgi:hypothetical protein
MLLLFILQRPIQHPTDDFRRLSSPHMILKNLTTKEDGYDVILHRHDWANARPITKVKEISTATYKTAKNTILCVCHFDVMASFQTTNRQLSRSFFSSNGPSNGPFCSIIDHDSILMTKEHDADYRNYRQITPTAAHRMVQAVTPCTPGEEVVTTKPAEASPMDQLRCEVEEARMNERELTQAFLHLTEGIRAVKRIIERAPCSSGKQPVLIQDDSSETTEKAILSADDLFLSELSGKFGGVIGSDLLGLVNAADMVRDHACLASEEASTLLQDFHSAQQAAEKENERATKAETVVRKLYKENVAIKKENAKLRKERRALAGEVKSLREQLETTKKFDVWRLLEQHVLTGIQVHEKILTRAPQKREESVEMVRDELKEEGRENSDPVLVLTSNNEVYVDGSHIVDKRPENESSNQAYPGSVATQDKEIPNAGLNEEQQTAESEKQDADEDIVASIKVKKRTVGFGGMSGFGRGVGLGYGTRFGKESITKLIKKPSKQPPQASEDPQQESSFVYDSKTFTCNKDMCKESHSTYIPVQLGGDEKSSSDPRKIISVKSEDDMGHRMLNFFTGHGRRSPTLSVEETTVCCTEDSVGDIKSAHNQSNITGLAEELLKFIPRDVTFRDDGGEEAASRLATPMCTPETSPSGFVVSPDLKPICDPKILRTLAIPSQGKDAESVEDLPSARACLGHGLYTC